MRVDPLTMREKKLTRRFASFEFLMNDTPEWERREKENGIHKEQQSILLFAINLMDKYQLYHNFFSLICKDSKIFVVFTNLVALLTCVK